jgi:predicted DNA-binding ArsR family transcriptional regulator
MVDSELVAAYRLNAANCTHKIALLDMAQAWLRLAEITEKFGEALQNVPAPLIMPSGSGQS